jgi:hypothetical protein
MSKIKDLKTNSDNSLNLISVLELFTPENKSKYVDLLLRLMKNTPNLSEHGEEIKAELTSRFSFITNEKLNQFNDIQLMLIYKFIDGFFNIQDLESFKKFCDYNERNLITQNDLTKYKSFDEVINAANIADIKSESKDLENQIVKIFEDDEWLLVRPLTYLASRKYGANTKWCTTSEGNPEYFTKYTTRGVLIYCINKITGYKVASFYSLDKNDPEFSFWNQKDTRIDSLDSELTDELRKLIQDVSKDKKARTNRFLLSDDQRTKEEKLLNHPGLYKSGAFLNESIPVERPLRNRIEDAVRRENEERAMETEYEDRENISTEEPDSIIDRMMWKTTDTNSIPETIEHNRESYNIRNDISGGELRRG